MSVKLFSISEAAKIIGTTAPKIFTALRAHGALIEQGNMRNTPRIKFIAAGYFRVHYTEYRTGPVVRQHVTTRVTPTGLAYIAELLTCSGSGKTNITNKAPAVTLSAPSECKTAGCSRHGHHHRAP